jgi:hypothetical protein
MRQTVKTCEMHSLSVTFLLTRRLAEHVLKLFDGLSISYSVITRLHQLTMNTGCTLLSRLHYDLRIYRGRSAQQFFILLVR